MVMTDPFRLDGKVALVTGGARGIGKAICRAFAAAGARVMVTDVDELEAARTTADLWRIQPDCASARLDVTRPESVASAVEQTLRRFGRIDILVNNAAYVRTSPQYFHESNPLEWDPQIDVNFKSVLYCCRAVIPHMIAQGGGRIINISSNAGKATPAKYAVYGACKAAVAGFTRCLARELGRHNILVNTISPGTIRTPAIEAGLTAKNAEKWAAATILGRIGEPEDVANMILFLASEGGNYITAQNYSIDGGMTSSH
jgi:2-hydroxycyclohexanecarboxyl-CoA dehydrogenase